MDMEMDMEFESALKALEFVMENELTIVDIIVEDDARIWFYE